MLYITYDGLLDPLGGSQILPYVYSISEHPRSVHILSFEKPDRLRAGKDALRARLTNKGIAWTPLSFTHRFGLLGKFWDLLQSYFFGLRIVLGERRLIVHARGHVSAQVGLFLKRWLGAKLLFDCRGLWVDERVDKGGWDMNRLFHRLQYRYYKHIERTLFSKADHIVVLTAAVVPEVIQLGAASTEKVTVIPCCADFDHFKLADVEGRNAARRACGVPTEALVLGYLGSVGGMYLSDRFFRLVELAMAENHSIHVLALTPDVEKFIVEMRNSLSSLLQGRVHVRSANRDEVAQLVPGMDVLIGFIRPTYARVAASPTKLAESFAAGVPAICNVGVGDVSEIVKDLDAGLVLDAYSDPELEAAANHLPLVIAKGGARLREVSRGKLGLEVAVNRYKNVYMRLGALC